MGKPGIWDICENCVCCILNKLYPRAKSPASLRPIARFTLEIASFVCDHATRIENQNLWSKGVVMYAYSISVYYA